MNTLGPEFTKGSRSNISECVELRMTEDGNVEVRDSKNPTGPTLLFTPKEYDAFVGSIEDGELRRP
jgi:hypothetical protein